MSNYISDLPVELKLEVHQQSDYLTQLTFYLYLIKYESFDTRYINVLKERLYRQLESTEIRTLIEYDQYELLDIILRMKPTVEYLDNYMYKIPMNSYDKIKKVVPSQINGVKTCILIYIILEAAHTGSLNILKAYSDLFPHLDSNHQYLICQYLITGGHMEVLNYVRSKDVEWNHTIFIGAARANNFDLFKFYHLSNLGFKENPVITPDLLGDKNMINTCHIIQDIEMLYDIVAEHGNIEFLEYLHKIKPIKNGKHLSPSLKKGHKCVIEWGIKNMIPMSTEHCNVAASVGNLELLRWLISVGCPWDPNIRLFACNGGNIKLFNYTTELLFIKNIPVSFSEKYMQQAAGSNQLEMVKYLHRNGYAPSVSVVSSYNFEMFKYGIDNKFFIFEGSQVHDLMGNLNKEYLEYAINGGYLMEKNLIVHYFNCGNIEMLKYSRERFPDLFLEASKKFTESIFHHAIVWAVENGYGTRATYIERAIIDNNISMFLWLLNRGGVLEESHLKKAIQFDRLDPFKMMIHLYDPEKLTIRDALESDVCINIIKYLHSVGKLPLELDLYHSFDEYPEMISWLHEIRYPKKFRIDGIRLVGMIADAFINKG